MKLLAILSGGIDSATALADVLDDHEVKHALFFRYGQRNLDAERKASRAVAAHYGVERIETIVPSYMHAISKHAEAEVPKDRSIEEIVPTITGTISGVVPATFVPGRNLVMIALAASLAYELELHGVVGGWHWDDSSGYPDCRPEFLSAAQNAVSLALGRSIMVVRPLISLSKTRIVELGYDLGVPLGVTHSCYTPVDLTDVHKTDLRNPLASPRPGPVTWAHCGHCDACILRKHAFAEAGVLDETKYAKEVG